MLTLLSAQGAFPPFARKLDLSIALWMINVRDVVVALQIESLSFDSKSRKNSMFLPGLSSVCRSPGTSPKLFPLSPHTIGMSRSVVIPNSKRILIFF